MTGDSVDTSIPASQNSFPLRFHRGSLFKTPSGVRGLTARADSESGAESL